MGCGGRVLGGVGTPCLIFWSEDTPGNVLALAEHIAYEHTGSRPFRVLGYQLRRQAMKSNSQNQFYHWASVLVRAMLEGTG